MFSTILALFANLLQQMRRSRRLLTFRLVLLALLLWGQLGGVAHALSHIHSANSDAIAEGKFCPDCVSQSQSASALPASFVFATPLFNPPAVYDLAPQRSPRFASIAAYFGRAPPLA